MGRVLRILIIEDAPTDAELEEYELRKAGLVFTSRIVDTEETYLKELSDFVPDIILSDYDLPTFDGLAALRIAKKKCPEVPFIIVSGKLGEDFAIEKLKEGATDYVLKSNLKRLFPVIKRALQETEEIAERKKLEKTLQEQEQQYRSIFNSVTDGILIFDNEGRVVEANPAACSMHGYSREEMIGLTGPDFVHPDFHGRFAQFCKTAPGKIFIEEPMDIRKDGSLFPLQVRGSVFEFRGKSHVLAVITDISERKRAEESLRISEERYRSLVENQTELICRFNPDGTFVFVNDVYCAFFGKTKDELIGKKWFPIPIDEDLTLIQEKLKEMSPTSPVVIIENRVASSKGDIRWIQFVNKGFFDLHGNLLEIQSVGRDITESKRAGDALKESEERFRKVFEDGPLGMVIVSPTDRSFLRANDMFCKLLGYTEEELKRLTFLDVTHPEHRGADTEAINKLREGKIPKYVTEKRYLKKNGEMFWAALTASVVRREDGQPLYFLAMIEEITKKRSHN